FAAVLSCAADPDGRARSSRPARPGSARPSSGSRRLRIHSPGGTPAVLPREAEKWPISRSYYFPGIGGSRKGIPRDSLGPHEAGSGAFDDGVGLTAWTSARQYQPLGYPWRILDTPDA